MLPKRGPGLVCFKHYTKRAAAHIPPYSALVTAVCHLWSEVQNTIFMKQTLPYGMYQIHRLLAMIASGYRLTVAIPINFRYHNR